MKCARCNKEIDGQPFGGPKGEPLCEQCDINQTVISLNKTMGILMETMESLMVRLDTLERAGRG